MSNPAPKPTGNMVITTAEGELKVVKNWLHQFGVMHPLTLAAGAFAIGLAVAAFFHL